jgi:hypothetical protein
MPDRPDTNIKQEPPVDLVAPPQTLYYRVVPLSQAAYKLPLPVIELEVQPETLTRLRLDVLKIFRQLLDSQ